MIRSSIDTTGGISVIGAGSFGTAISAALCRSGHLVNLYCRSVEQALEIESTRQNRRFFPGHKLPDQITATNDLELALSSDVIFMAFPAQVIDYYVDRIASTGRPGTVIVNLAKGFHGEYFTFSRLVEDKCPEMHYVALKGPTFAKPMFLGELSGMSCGTKDIQLQKVVAELFDQSNIDLDFHSSACAVEVASGVKNIYAIVLGVSAALDFSENTRFLLVTKIIREIQVLLDELKLPNDVLYTYSGLGDTLLTGFCDTSRNRTLGFMLGRGLHIDNSRSGFLVEGAKAISILCSKIDRRKAPILSTLADIIEHKAQPLALLEALSSQRQHHHTESFKHSTAPRKHKAEQNVSG